MAPTLITKVEIAGVVEAPAIARFLRQLDAQRRMLHEQTRGLTTAELDWQPAPGMNTIGMLLAHIAYAQCHLTHVGLEGRATSDTRRVIGITEAEEGMPLAPGAPPAPAIAGHDLGWFDSMLEHAAAEMHRVAATLGDRDLAREVQRPRPDGSERVFDLGWVFYHLIEHEAGHRGQIGLLRHLYRTGPGAARVR